MKYCTQCGRPLAEGERCPCGGANNSLNIDSAKGYVESLKNRIGIGDPELNKGDAFEKKKKIVPDCVRASEGEIPVKQYNVATLQNRILGIAYTKATGRIQVTNKRVIFRAPGRCWAGRTTLQHEFAIDELAGLEARREYVFNLFDLIIGFFVTIIGGSIITALISAMFSSGGTDGQNVGAFIITLLFGVAGCVPFFMLKKKWLLKLLCLGGSFMPMLASGGFLSFLGFISALIAIFTLLIYAIKPNLVLAIKTKSASAGIDIKRKKTNIFGIEKEENTGYTEVIPEDDAERCIREIDAIINDIQKLGDFGIEKWKS